MSIVTLKKTPEIEVFPPITDFVSLFVTDGGDLAMKDENGDTTIIGGLPNPVKKVEITLDLGEITNLHITPITVTGAELGLVAGKGSIIQQAQTLWQIDPDGTPFVDGGNLIKVNGSVAVAAINGTQIAVASKKIFSVPTTTTEELIDNGDYTITASGAITGGGASSYIKVTLFFIILEI